VEKETGQFIKCIRIDRGAEFNSLEFNEFCKQNDIKRQLTIAYTPQQNGVAERKNRTVMNLVRSMLSKKKIDTIKELMSYPKCSSVEVINNPARPGSNHREVNYINYK
jgi:transposase InsO family protein